MTMHPTISTASCIRAGRRRPLWVGLAAACVLYFFGCPTDEDPAPAPSSVQVSDGDMQTATAGTAVATAPAVVVRDASGNPVSGVTVTFSVTAGGGTVTGGTPSTNSSGIATVGGWTLGPTAGDNTLQASVTGVSTAATFTATGIPGPAAVLSASAGDNQSATVGMPVMVAPAVHVGDINGNGVEGVDVTFAVATGGGSITGEMGTSDVSGVVAVGSWTLGTTAGENTITATVAGLTVFTFVATGTADMAATITIDAGNNQTADAGTAVPVDPSVLVEDMNGNPVPDATVMFQVASGGGSVTGGTQLTDANGIATVGSWVLGNAPGPNSMTATTGALSPVTFDATGVVGPPGIVEIVDGDGQSAEVGTAVATAPSVRVTDIAGNPIAGVDVDFTVQSGGGSVTGTPATTDGSGIATVGSWTLGLTAGENTLQASTPGATSATFTATGTAGAAATMSINDGDNQSATAGTEVPTAPSVLVEDANNNPVPGVSVAFAVTGGGGSVSGSPATTDANGIARVGGWTLGSNPGPNTLDATIPAAPGIPAVTFNATGLSGAANVTANDGDGQSATVNTAVATAPQVLVTDALFNPVPNEPVTFAVASGGGNITGATTMTDASGLASVGSWTLGQTAGENTLTATVTGLTPVTFTATGLADAATSMTAFSGDNQMILAGSNTLPPRVIVTDQFQNPVSGVDVDFAVTAGGGAVGGSPGTTNADGVAQPGSWTLGGTPGANMLQATSTGLTPFTFTATGVTAGFDIDVRIQTMVTMSVQQAFDNAEARWEALVVGELSDQLVDIAADACGISHPAVNETIDDLVIFAVVEAIDGVGGVLGSAGPCIIRGTPGTTVLGTMRFDEADLDNLDMNGQLEDVILHEMGHVLGLGTLWGSGFFDFLRNPSLPNSPGVDTHFDGPLAVTAFDEIGGTNYSAGEKVPVENTQGGQGTRDGHWRESVLANELMTGFIDAGLNPMSLLSVASMADMTYAIDPDAADAFMVIIPGPAAARGPRIQLVNDIHWGPIFVANPSGQPTLIRR